MYLSFYLAVSLSICLSVYLSIYLSIYVCMYLSIYVCMYLSIYLSASLKTKLFCETSSVFELDNIKNSAILETSSNFETWQHHLSKPEDLMLQNATPLRKSAPWPPNISHEHVFLYCSCHAKCIFADPLQMSHACHRFWKCYKTLTFAHFWQGAQSLLPTTQNDIWRSKSAPYPQFFALLTSKCASGHNRVHFLDISTSKSGPSMVCFVHFDFEIVLRATTACTFFDISTSKSGPRMVCFVHFDLEMCFAPQRRALFRHLNFQKWSENGVFCTFWLRNVLRATTACNFSSLIWPAGSAPAALASLLFDPPEPQIIGKTLVFRDFPTFSRICIFFLLTFSSLILSLLLSSSLCLCPALLFICPYCRKFDF